MQKAVKLSGIGFVWVLAMVLSGYKTSATYNEVSVTLSEALQKKWITSEYTGAGSYSGHCIKISVANLENKNIKVVIPAGTMFKPSEDDMQNILVTEEQVLALEPKGKKQTLLRGYCCEATDRSPAKDISFTLSANKDPKMAQLFTFIKGKKFSDQIQQEAVWCISNNHQVSDIYAPNMASIKPLRDELCRITGQKDTWYNTPKTHSVDANGNISHNTTEVNGLVKFKVVKEAKVHNEVHDANGNLVLKNPNEFTVRPGNVEYEFGIKVQGWVKGTYFVKVFEDEKVIHQQEFRI